MPDANPQQQNIPDILDHVLTAANITVDAAEREELRAQFEQRVSTIVIETMVQNLTVEQRKQFLDAVAEDGDAAEQKIADLAARIPGLEEKTNQAIAREIDTIVAAFKGRG